MNKSRCLLLTISLLLSGPLAHANPTGAQVVQGTASFSSPSANVLNINNSHNAIINWQQFNIGAGQTTNFNQPSSASSVLNRVISNNPSQIMGSLNPNGRVFLINQNGILMGQGASINTNGFFGSTLNITDSDFLNGKLKFQGGGLGDIENHGYIHAGENGHIVLIAPNIENGGVIEVDNGNIILTAGKSINITSLENSSIQFEVSSSDNKITNLGKIIASQGAASLFAGSLQHSGSIRANGLVQDADGTIRLIATHRADVNGSIDVSGAIGGKIEITAEVVNIDDGATINASGTTKGGEILIGGDQQGLNPEVRNARSTTIAKNAVVHADATDNGDGGKVIVFASNDVHVHGEVTARGGANGGDGGFVETSGMKVLDITSVPDASANNGKPGEWLIDPENIIITTVTANITDPNPAGDPGPASFTSTVPNTATTLDVALINTALNNGSNVTVNTASAGTTDLGDITLNADIIKSLDGGQANGSVITLIADNDIFINANILDTTSVGSGLAVNLNAGNHITLTNSIIDTGGTSLTLTATRAFVTGSVFLGDLNTQFRTNNIVLNAPLDVAGIFNVGGGVESNANFTGSTLTVLPAGQLIIDVNGCSECSSVSFANPIINQGDFTLSSVDSVSFNNGFSHEGGALALNSPTNTSVNINSIMSFNGGSVTSATGATLRISASGVLDAVSPLVIPSIMTLRLDGGSISNAQNLTIPNTFNISGGVINGASSAFTTPASSTTTYTGSNDLIVSLDTVAFDWVSNGIFNFNSTGGDLDLLNSVFTNNGTMNFNNTAGGADILNDLKSIVSLVNGAGGTMNVAPLSNLDFFTPFNNFGRVNVQGASIFNTDNTTTNSGIIDIAPSATYLVRKGSTNDASILVLTATSSMTGTGIWRIDGGNINGNAILDAAAPSSIASGLTLELNGVINNAQNLTIPDTFNWVGGTISGSGDFITPSTSTTTIKGAATASTTLQGASTTAPLNWFNDGIINWNGTISAVNDITLTNANIFNDGEFYISLATTASISGTGRIINGVGAVLGIGTSSDPTFNVPFDNFGVLDIVLPGDTLFITNDLKLENSALLMGGGTLNLSAGTGTLTVGNGGGISPGQNADGSLTIDGKLIIDPGAQLMFDLESNTLFDKILVSFGNTVTINGGDLFAFWEGPAGTTGSGFTNVLNGAQFNFIDCSASLIACMTVNTPLNMHDPLNVNPAVTPLSVTFPVTDQNSLEYTLGTKTGTVFEWTGTAGDGLWTSPSNWLGGAAPVPGASVIIDGNGAVIPVAITGSVNIANLQTDALLLFLGGSLSIGGQAVVSPTYGPNSGTLSPPSGLLLAGPGSTITGSGVVTTLPGTYSVFDSDTNVTISTWDQMGVLSKDGTNNLVFDGTIFNNIGAFEVEPGSTGNVALLNSGQFNNHGLIITESDVSMALTTHGPDGKIDVEQGTLTFSRSLIADGLFNINKDATLTLGAGINLGFSSSSEIKGFGTLLIPTSSTLTIDPAAIFDQDQNLSLVLDGSSLVFSNDIFVGNLTLFNTTLSDVNNSSLDVLGALSINNSVIDGFEDVSAGFIGVTGISGIGNTTVFHDGELNIFGVNDRLDLLSGGILSSSSGSGPASVTGAGTLNLLTGSDWNVDVPGILMDVAMTLNLNGGFLNSAENLGMPGTVNINVSNITEFGVITIPTATTLNYAATTPFSPTLGLINNGTLNIRSAVANIDMNAGGIGLENNGTVAVFPNINLHLISLFQNNGAIGIGSGSSFIVEPTGVLNMNGGSVNGTGNLIVKGGLMNFAAATTLSSTIGLNLNTGSITGAENLSIPGNFKWDDGVISGTGSGFTTSGTVDLLNGVLASDWRITPTGVVNWAGDNFNQLTIINSTITNEGQFNIRSAVATGSSGQAPPIDTAPIDTAGRDFSTSTGAAFINKGSLRLGDPDGSILDPITFNLNFTNDGGNIGILSGTFKITDAQNNPVDLVLNNGSVLQGIGTFEGNIVNAGGVVTPGLISGSTGTPGKLSVSGNFTQLAGGALNISLDSTANGLDSSQLSVTGQMTAGGAINFNIINGKTATQLALLLNESFSPISYGSFAGKFSSVAVPPALNFSFSDTGVVTIGTTNQQLINISNQLQDLISRDELNFIDIVDAMRFIDRKSRVRVRVNDDDEDDDKRAPKLVCK